MDTFILTNRQGAEVQAIAYGAIITRIRVPDRNGKLDDVAPGFDKPEDYLRNPPYFGAVVGRFANRIALGRFTLDGVQYSLAANNGPNHLHGGTRGFDKVFWTGTRFEDAENVGVAFRYRSPDGEEGYPGNLDAAVTYTWTDRNQLIVDYSATTDRPTPVNLSQHTYFNLAGEGNGDVLNHEVTIDADRYTPVDTTLIPTGVLAPVDGTPFDFRKPTQIGSRINDNDEQLKFGHGYDHNFVINRSGDGLVRAASVYEPVSGRLLDVMTTEPGIQFYSGNYLGERGKSGHIYTARTGFCLETQKFPDSPNHPQFPSCVLRPGKEYRSQTVFTFIVRKTREPAST
jgi:aldose 1-epimerase